MSRRPHVVVLGGGPAGCGAAYQLRRLDRADVTLVERQGHFGGNASSFEWAGQFLDFGSHRLHYTTEPTILGDIRTLLEGDLLARKRNGRILLRNRYVRFPFKVVDLLTSLDKRFASGVLFDMTAGKLGARRNSSGTSFADVLLRSLGPTICRSFYFPYARKIWGHEPTALSGIQAQRRVTANSFVKLLKRIVKPVGDGMFYYPRRGFGQITNAYAQAAGRLGASMLLDTAVERLQAPASPEGRWQVHVSTQGNPRILDADYVWSTIPITMLARLTSPAPPPELAGPTPGIDYRAMLLVYLQLDVDRFTPTDAHYFPEEEISITRLSEPKNYSDRSEPRGSTVLCAELPCAPGDATWSMSDEELGALVVRDIRTAGLPLVRPPVSVLVKRLRHAYPIYLNGYERHFDALDAWVGGQPRLLTFGRQGLFAHDNTHHALFMAYCAVECLEDGAFNDARWEGFRRMFATHVVED
ncbi:MAG TPA: FAD-dependent oxidoreductase [Gemmatimonadaceae bacterium]